MPEIIKITDATSGQIKTATAIHFIETEAPKSASVRGSLLDDIIEYADTFPKNLLSIIHKHQLKKFIDNYTKELLHIILEQDFEYGFDSPADLFIKHLLNQNPTVTREWLNYIFQEYFYDQRILIGLLQILSHMDYFEIYPQGQAIAVAALSHLDSEVRECGIRAFENWSNIVSLNVLRNLKYPEEWLQEYVQQVISDLEEELASHAFSR